MSFLDIARPLAERGFRVAPLLPKLKFPGKMSWGDFFDAATTDISALEQWDREVPQANVGISPDENFCFLETDSETEMMERSAVAGVPKEVWGTARVSSGRPDRAYYIFRQTMRTRKAGNMTATRAGKDNLFEFKQHRVLIVGPGSIHPKKNPATGEHYVYGAEWRPIPALPDVLLNFLCAECGAPKASEAHKMDAETARQTELLDRVLETYEVPPTGDWFNKGKSWYRPIECPWSAQHDNSNQGTSTCIVYTEGTGYGFDCKHRCADKGWKEFRAEVQSHFPERKFRFMEPTAEVTIGSAVQVALEEAVQPARSRPAYPIAVWDGTAAGEFGKLCGHDNNVPRKVYVEAFLCCLGAVVGDRISCPVDGALPRSDTIIIAPKGKGKGTGIRRAVRFFSQTWNGSAAPAHGALSSVTSGLLSGERDFIWKPRGIGAWMAAASSVPGMARLTKELESTIKNKPHLLWGNSLPRILSVHEEMKTFLSTLFIEGGVGSGMEGVICQLWDDVTFNGTATGTRDAVYGEMLFSLLAAVTEEDWFDLLSRGNTVGGGLMSRLNIIGTEGGYENVSKMTPPDFTSLQETFLPRIMRLEDAHIKVQPTEGADSVISEWADNLPEGSERMNVHAWRNALRLAWLRHEETISEKTACDAVLLGQYQLASHEFYRTKQLDTANARVQEKILRALKMKGPMSKRQLQQVTHASRDGTALWNTALDGLVREALVGKREDGTHYLAGTPGERAFKP